MPRSSTASLFSKLGTRAYPEGQLPGFVSTGSLVAGTQLACNVAGANPIVNVSLSLLTTVPFGARALHRHCASPPNSCAQYSIFSEMFGYGFFFLSVLPEKDAYHLQLLFAILLLMLGLTSSFSDGVKIRRGRTFIEEARQHVEVDQPEVIVARSAEDARRQLEAALVRNGDRSDKAEPPSIRNTMNN